MTYTKKDILNDERIESLDLFERGHWSLLCKKGYLFFGNQRSVLGTIREICQDMEFLKKEEDR